MNSPDTKSPPFRIGWILAGLLLWAAVIGLFYHFASQKRAGNPQAGGSAIAAPKITAIESDEESAGSDAVEPGGQSEETEEQGQPDKITIKLPARPLPDFELTEVSGRKVTLADLKGRRWVASFVFSSCTLTCPEITRNLSKLRERLRSTDNDILFVSISVLPEVDTPEKFGNWASIFRDEDDENWWFLTGDKNVIYDLMRSYFLQYVKEHTKGTVPPGMEVAHSNRVILVNEDAIPVATYLAVNDADLVRLRRVLTGKEEFPTPGPAGSAEESPVPSPADLGAEEQPASDNASPAANDQDATGIPNPKTDPAGWNQRIEGLLPQWIQRLPPANAGLNLTALVLLLTGYRAIRRRRIAAHRALMLSAFAVSIVFLANYLTYHWALNHYAGVRFRAFTGVGIWSVLYRVILWPHVVMAALVPFLAIVTLWHAFRGRLEQHRRIAKVTFPVWVFVSVSGVVVYGMLNHWPV